MLTISHGSAASSLKTTLLQIHCHCHLTMSCIIKIQNGLPFWCRLTQDVLEKRPLNRCSVVTAHSEDARILNVGQHLAKLMARNDTF